MTNHEETKQAVIAMAMTDGNKEKFSLTPTDIHIRLSGPGVRIPPTDHPGGIVVTDSHCVPLDEFIAKITCCAELPPTMEKIGSWGMRTEPEIDSLIYSDPGSSEWSALATRSPGIRTGRYLGNNCVLRLDTNLAERKP